jgi:hypothetical protein
LIIPSPLVSQIQVRPRDWFLHLLRSSSGPVTERDFLTQNRSPNPFSESFLIKSIIPYRELAFLFHLAQDLPYLHTSGMIDSPFSPFT